MRRKYIGFIALSVLWTWQMVGQSTSVYLYDRETEKPVEFAYAYDQKSTYISDVGGYCRFTEGLIGDTLWISHISYVFEAIPTHTLSQGDTIFLDRSTFELQEFTVLGLVEQALPDINYHKYLNKLLKKYQGNRSEQSAAFKYSLRTSIDHAIVENLDAVIEVDYSVGKKIQFPRQWLRTGDFRFDPDVPFLNLDMERLILEMQPFADSDRFELMTAGKITKRNHEITPVSYEADQGGRLRLSIEGDHHRVLMEISMEEERIISSVYHLDEECALEFYNLQTNDTYSFDSLVIRYDFDAQGFPELIRAHNFVNDGKRLFESHLVLDRLENNRKDTRFFVTSDPQYHHIYEQILFQPWTSDRESPIDLLTMKVEEYDRLKQAQRDDRKNLLSSVLCGSRFLVLDGLYDSIPIRIQLEDHIPTSLGGIPIHWSGSRIQIHNALGLVGQDQDSLVVGVPVLDISQSIAHVREYDPYIVQLAVQLALWYNHELVLSLQDSLESYSSQEIFERIKSEKMLDPTKVEDLFNQFLHDPGILGMVRTNEAIFHSLGVDVFSHVLSQDYGCSECRESIVAYLISTAISLQKEDEADALICYEQALRSQVGLMRQLEAQGLTPNDLELHQTYTGRLMSISRGLKSTESEYAQDCIRYTRSKFQERLQSYDQSEMYRQHFGEKLHKREALDYLSLAELSEMEGDHAEACRLVDYARSIYPYGYAKLKEMDMIRVDCEKNKAEYNRSAPKKTQKRP